MRENAASQLPILADTTMPSRSTVSSVRWADLPLSSRPGAVPRPSARCDATRISEKPRQVLPCVLEDPDEIIRHVDAVEGVIEVDFAGNVDVDAAVLRNGGVIAVYSTRDDEPRLPFWPMLFDNITIRLLVERRLPA